MFHILAFLRWLDEVFWKHNFCRLIKNGKPCFGRFQRTSKRGKITGGALEFHVVLTSKHACNQRTGVTDTLRSFASPIGPHLTVLILAHS